MLSFPSSVRSRLGASSPVALGLVGLACLFATAESQAQPLLLSGRDPFREFLGALQRGGDDGLPSSYAGVWEFTATAYECSTNDIVSTDSGFQTFCTGENVNSDPDLVCIGTVTDSSFHFECSDTGVLSPECSFVISAVMDAALSGDNLNITMMLTIVSAPTNCSGMDSCLRLEWVGTRIAPEPANCATPVEAISWGEVKAMYR